MIELTHCFRVWSSEKAELSSNFRNAERLRSVKSNEISSLRDKIAEQEFIMTESVFKYPRVPSSVSSNDVTPMNNSPIKPQDSKKAQENVFINKVRHVFCHHCCQIILSHQDDFFL